MAKALGPLSRSEDARRELIVCAVACAERALPLFEEASRGDGQAQQPAAIAAARACGQAAAVVHMAPHARAVPSYVLEALTLAHPDDLDLLDSEKAWQRAHLPEGFADFVYPAG